MKDLVKILSASKRRGGWAKSRDQLKENWWTPPKFTSSGLPLKGFLIRKINWILIMKDLDPALRVAMSDLHSTKFIYPQLMDKYLIKLWTRLHRYAIKGDTAKYDQLVKIACAHSKSLRILAMCHVDDDWTAKFSLSKSRWWYKGIKWMLTSMEPFFLYKRVWIPKVSGDGERPLAVPNIVARSTARIQYLFCQCWIHGSGHISPVKMHGTTLGTGVGTAISEVIKNIDKKFIYEFDVKKFFNSVNFFDLARHWNVRTIANNHMDFHYDYSYNDRPELFPGMLLRWIHNSIEIGRGSLPRDLVEKEKMQEALKTKQFNQFLHIEIFDYMNSRPGSTPLSNPPHFNYIADTERYHPQMANAMLALTDFGLPQGYGPSPILSSMAIKPILDKYNVVMYVDDGLLFSDEEIDIKQLDEDFSLACGLSLSLEKSKWIKKDGVWLEDLKFLGITITQDGKIGSKKVKPFNLSEIPKSPYGREKVIDDKFEFLKWISRNQKDANKIIAWLYDPKLDSVSDSMPKIKWKIHKDSLVCKDLELSNFLKVAANRSPTQMVSLISPFGGELYLRDFIKPK